MSFPKEYLILSFEGKDTIFFGYTFAHLVAFVFCICGSMVQLKKRLLKIVKLFLENYAMILP